jgi:LysM repeat protein
MDNCTRCSDTNDTLDGFILPKGKGGVSILCSTAWTNNIKMLDDGNERIIAILISASTKFCLINAYMPSCTNSSQTEYRECIDIITDIIEKYQTTHKIVLCGDMNGTLLENRSNKHDKILKMFVKESNLTTGDYLPETHTFHHHAGNSSSQIDYILVQDPSLVNEYIIDQKSGINLSAHTTVRMRTTSGAPLYEKQVSNKIPAKAAKYILQWEDLNNEKYKKEIQQKVRKIKPEDDLDYQTETLMQILSAAENISVPRTLLRMKEPKWKASPEVLVLLKIYNDTYRERQKIGKPTDHELAISLKIGKKKLRSKMRMEQTMDRQNIYQQIMDNPNTQLFYRLINRNRNGHQSSTNCLMINGDNIFCLDEQRKCFAKYYEDISIPNEEQFDNNYLNLCRLRQSLTDDKMDGNNFVPEQFTPNDVVKVIKKLNLKKSADEFGITSEHLKHSSEVIAPILSSIFYHILAEVNIPDSFKSGIVTPVLKKHKDPTIMGNYRGITVTAAIGNTFEYCLLDKLNLKSNSPLQFGFTSSLCPIMAGLLISEARYEKKLDKENFYITFLDVKSAFDVVRHEILVDKLLDQKLNPIYWKNLREVYSDLSSKVKWLDGLSQPFSIKQEFLTKKGTLEKRSQ